MILREETERGRGPIAALILAARNDIDHDLDAAVSGLLAAIEAETAGLRAEVARLRQDAERAIEGMHLAEALVLSHEGHIEKLHHHILRLRSLTARLPIGELSSSPALQSWWDEMKDVMAATNPSWLSARQEGRTDG